MTIPDAPDTPPRGGAHRHVDTASMAERAIDKARDAEKIAMHADDRSAVAFELSQKHADIIETIPAMHAKLDLALRPTITPSYVRFATVAAAAAMLVSSIALVAIVVLLAHSTPASASNLPQAAQAANRVQAP